MVADEMTTRSLRFFWIFFSRPSSRSVDSVRSCASSTITTEYLDNSGSTAISLISTSFVQNLIRVVASFDTSSKSTPYPTSSPSRTPISSATRAATVTAANLEGCAHAICSPFGAQPARCRYCGTWVLLPLPVSPTTIVVACRSTK